MTVIDKVRGPLLAALMLATVASCGEPAERGTASRPDAWADPAPPVVSGEVAAFKPLSSHAGAPKRRDAAGSLPSNVATGTSAVYAPAGRQALVGSTTPPAGAATP